MPVPRFGPPSQKQVWDLLDPQRQHEQPREGKILIHMLEMAANLANLDESISWRIRMQGETLCLKWQSPANLANLDESVSWRIRWIWRWLYRYNKKDDIKKRDICLILIWHAFSTCRIVFDTRRHFLMPYDTQQHLTMLWNAFSLLADKHTKVAPSSDVQGPARPKNPGFGSALLGSGLAKQWAGP